MQAEQRFQESLLKMDLLRMALERQLTYVDAPSPLYNAIRKDLDQSSPSKYNRTDERFVPVHLQRDCFVHLPKPAALTGTLCLRLVARSGFAGCLLGPRAAARPVRSRRVAFVRVCASFAMQQPRSNV